MNNQGGRRKARPQTCANVTPPFFPLSCLRQFHDGSTVTLSSPPFDSISQVNYPHSSPGYPLLTSWDTVSSFFIVSRHLLTVWLVACTLVKFDHRVAVLTCCFLGWGSRLQRRLGYCGQRVRNIVFMVQIPLTLYLTGWTSGLLGSHNDAVT